MPKQGKAPERKLEFYEQVLESFSYEMDVTTTRDGPTFTAFVAARDNDGQQQAIMVKLHRNTYNHQSYGNVSAWTEHGWKVIHSIPYPLLELVRVPTSHAVGERVSGTVLDAMYRDGAALLRVAKKTTGWKYADDSFTFD